jgi:DNA-binding response OmpR family regulator
MTTLLIVDDDADLRKMLRTALESEGFRILEAGDAERGLYEYASHAVDVVTVDIRLPGMSGLEFCREIRRRGDVPILAMTALGSATDMGAAFDAGVDDYLVKPFGLKQLRSRLWTLVGRHAQNRVEPSSVVVGDLRIQMPDGEADNDGVTLGLTPIEARVLAVLAERVGRVVLREELAERVWGSGRLDDLGIVDQHVERLRRRLESGSSAKVSVDSSSAGYRLLAR